MGVWCGLVWSSVGYIGLVWSSAWYGCCESRGTRGFCGCWYGVVGCECSVGYGARYVVIGELGIAVWVVCDSNVAGVCLACVLCSFVLYVVVSGFRCSGFFGSFVVHAVGRVLGVGSWGRCCIVVVDGVAGVCLGVLLGLLCLVVCMVVLG